MYSYLDFTWRIVVGVIHECWNQRITKCSHSSGHASISELQVWLKMSQRKATVSQKKMQAPFELNKLPIFPRWFFVGPSLEFGQQKQDSRHFLRMSSWDLDKAFSCNLLVFPYTLWTYSLDPFINPEQGPFCYGICAYSLSSFRGAPGCHCCADVFQAKKLFKSPWLWATVVKEYEGTCCICVYN